MAGVTNRSEDSFKKSRDEWKERKAACKRKLSQFDCEKVVFCGDLMIFDDSSPAGDNMNLIPRKGNDNEVLALLCSAQD